MTDANRSESARHQTNMQLVGTCELVISRTFRAPAEIVFDAWTQAELVARWWAPRSHGVVIDECRADVRVGGSYRYVLRRGDDSFGFGGVYQEITPHSRLVYTQIFDPFPDAPVLVTVTFEEVSGETRLTSHERYPSAEARAGALASGMEEGMRETMDQLDALVTSLPAA